MSDGGSGGSLEALDAGPPRAPVDDAAERLTTVARAQRMQALEKAYAVKRESALVRRLLKGRKIDPIATIAGTLADDPRMPEDAAERIEEAISGWSIERVLNAVPGIGPAKRHLVIETIGKSPGVKMRDMTFEDRARMASITRAARDPGVISL